jgi:hypothetical protein
VTDDVLTRLREIRDDLPTWLATGTRRVPTAREDLGMIGEPAVVARFNAEDRLRRASTRFLVLVSALDGARLTFAEADALAADPAAVMLLLSVRRSVYDELRHMGRISVGCPHCGAERTMGLAEVTRAVGREPPPLAGIDLAPALPSMAWFRSIGTRPWGVPRIASLALALPAGVAGLHTTARTAVLGPPLTPAGDAAAFRTWGQDDKPFTVELVHRHWDSPGFRTILRAMQLCERLDEHAPPALDLVEGLPVVDVLFIDAVHHLLYATDVNDPAGVLLPCASCGVPYLIVR